MHTQTVCYNVCITYTLLDTAQWQDGYDRISHEAENIGFSTSHRWVKVLLTMWLTLWCYSLQREQETCYSQSKTLLD